MKRWALVDPPQDWEIAFNEWVFDRFKIRNPLITKDLEVLKGILNSPSLFEKTLVDILPLPIQPPTNTVRLSPPTPNFGGARLVKVPQSWGI